MENVSWLRPISARVFVTTRWKVIAACRETDEAISQDAIAELCQAYWQPVYVCIRHHGYVAHDAQDLTQEFFMRVLKGTWLEQLDQAKGRFRAYLSVSLKNFLRDRWRRRRALFRGRPPTMISFDAADAEGSYSQMPCSEATPESLYERQWARALVHHTLEQLRIEMRAEGKEILFGHFDAIMTADHQNFPFSERAASLGLTTGALRVALYRWRQRFQVLIREEIARTVASKFDIENELRHLHLVLARTE